MKKIRKPSASLTKIVSDIDEDKLRRTRNRMLVAVRIADALTAKGISQKKFAEMTGRSESEISEWLSGDRNFTIDTLSDIQNYLGINLLNIPAIRTAPVSKEFSRLKVAKRRTPIVYAMNESLTVDVSQSWLPAANLELTAAI